MFRCGDLTILLLGLAFHCFVIEKRKSLCHSLGRPSRSDFVQSEFVKEYTMNIGLWLCGVLVIPFVIIGVLFAIFKEKAAKFVSGFNSLPKEEQALYDKAHISRDIKNQCFTWAGIMLVGAVLSYFLTPYMAIPAFIIWLVLFFKEVHFDTHKAFEKYLLK